MKTIRDIQDEVRKGLEPFTSVYTEKMLNWDAQQLERDIEHRNKYRGMVIDASNKTEYYELQRWYYSQPAWMFDAEKRSERVRKQAGFDMEKMVNKIMTAVTKHRMNTENLTVGFLRITSGTGFELRLEDGEKAMLFENILAYGMIQRPHFRLINKKIK